MFNIVHIQEYEWLPLCIASISVCDWKGYDINQKVIMAFQSHPSTALSGTEKYKYVLEIIIKDVPYRCGH